GRPYTLFQQRRARARARAGAPDRRALGRAADGERAAGTLSAAAARGPAQLAFVLATGGLRQRPHPDVAEADRRARVAVRLQLDRRITVRAVAGRADVHRLAGELEPVLHDHAVVERGQARRPLELAIGREQGRRPDNVITLPFAGREARISERNRLLVDGTCHPIDVSRVGVAVEYL